VAGGPLTAPVLAAAVVSGVLAIVGEERGPRTLVYACKPLTTLLILGLAAAAPCADPRYRALIVVGLAASLAGDVFLMLPRDRFVHGLASFLLTHLLYGLAFATAPAGLADAALLIGLLGVAAGIVRALWAGLGQLRGPVLLYVAAIIGMSWLACVRWRAGAGAGGALAAVGALSFVLSDALLALDRFRRRIPHGRTWVLATYYAAQILIGLSVRGTGSATPPSRPSEIEDAVHSLDPVRERLEAGVLYAFQQLALADPAGFQTGAARADRAAVRQHEPQQRLEVVVSLGYRLAGLGAGGAVAHQVHPHLFVLTRRERRGEPERVVRTLVAVGRVVHDEQGPHGFTSSAGNGRHSPGRRQTVSRARTTLESGAPRGREDPVKAAGYAPGRGTYKPLVHPWLGGQGSASPALRRAGRLLGSRPGEMKQTL
jgi:uncharacterized membrane protein YhhN